MNEAAAKELEATVDNLLAAVDSKSMEWAEANKTTYVWKNEKGDRLVLQKTGEVNVVVGGMTRKRSTFQLQAFAADSKLPQFTIDSAETRSLYEPMLKLFQAVQGSVARQGITFLRSILPPHVG